MSSPFIVTVSTHLLTDGIQTTFDIDLVQAPLYIAPVNDSGLSAVFLGTFDPVRPKPIDASALFGPTAVLNGYRVTITFPTPPAATITVITLQLHYAR